MTKKIDLILKRVLNKVEPSKEETDFIENSVKDFVGKIKKEISKLKEKPQLFVGGSYAKKTLIRKGKYDIDMFLRFGKFYDGKNLSEVTKKLLKKFENVKTVHGSRDYFRIKIREDLFIELVPVKKVSSPKNSENITDLSYSHVNYINKKVKKKRILDDIKLAKVFCHANNCYGAESYIKGFSGYALELLVYYYGCFEKMIKKLSKDYQGKILIDIEKSYKNKKNILLDLNSSKLDSPIILIDPTYPQRNVLAALSEETFERFRKSCKNFLKNPSEKHFEKQKVDLNKVKDIAKQNHQEFLLIEISTTKQEGDIAGSKLLKFYNHLTSEFERFFDVKKKGFNYSGKKTAKGFFVLSKKKEIIFEGPFKEDVKNSKKFKKEHKKVLTQNGRLFAREKISFSGKDFLKKWKLKNKRKIKEMSINGLKTL